MLDFGFDITGIEDAEGKIRRLPPRAIRGIQQKAEKRAEQTAQRFRTEMAAEYRSAWATGRVAAGIRQHTTMSSDGVQVRFSLPGYPEIEYITAMMGGYFQDFPVEPFRIDPVNGKVLTVPLPNGGARQFIRGRGGQFRGSRATQDGMMRVKSVLWGSKTGGFHRDVISEVAQEESELFVEDMQEAVEGAIVEVIGGNQ